jgi:hypothetical protein
MTITVLSPFVGDMDAVGVPPGGDIRKNMTFCPNYLVGGNAVGPPAAGCGQRRGDGSA